MAQLCAANFSEIINLTYSSKTYKKNPRRIFRGILENEILKPDMKRKLIFESKIQFFSSLLNQNLRILSQYDYHY